jgi:hypothetical protein
MLFASWDLGVPENASSSSIVSMPIVRQLLVVLTFPAMVCTALLAGGGHGGGGGIFLFFVFVTWFVLGYLCSKWAMAMRTPTPKRDDA